MTLGLEMECSEFRARSLEVLECDQDATEMGVLKSHHRQCLSCREWDESIRSTSALLGSIVFPEEEIGSLNTVKVLFRYWKAGDVLLPRSLDCVSLDSVLSDLVGKSPSQVCDALKGAYLSLSSALRNSAIHKTLELGSKDPQRAVQMGELAVALCDEATLSGRTVEESNEARLRKALALAALANARRICSDFARSFELFRLSTGLMEASDFSSLEYARIEQLRAHLLSDCQRFEEAKRSLDRARTIYSKLGATHMEGRTLIALGSMLGRSGRPSLAVELLKKGLVLVDIEIEPRLALVAKHNLVHYLFDAGSSDEALDIMSETRALHLELGNPVDLARLRWLEGQIALERDDLRDAESAFNEVKAFFVDKGVPHDTALVSLDLATVYLQQGRLPELKALSVEMLTIFDGIGTKRESHAALTFFEKAIELERAQVEMVKELLEYLTRIRFEERSSARLSVPT